MLVRRLQQNEEKSIHLLAFSPKEHTVATLDYEGELLLWDVDSGGCEYLETDEAFGEDSDCLAFSPDGTKIAAGNAYGQLRIWDVETGEHQTVEVDDDPITTLTFKNSSKILVVGTEAEYFTLILKDLKVSNGKDWRGGSNLQANLNGQIFWWNNGTEVSYCKEFDLCAVKHKVSRGISIFHSYVQEKIHRIHEIQIPHRVEDFSLSPSPHPDLSTIFTEVKFMLKDVGFILSTDDGIHFALRWESES
jgi:WD40 repeat protein